MPTANTIDANGHLTGDVYRGAGNVYANVDGALLSAPIRRDGTFSRDVDVDWCEVEDESESRAECAAARQALGMPVPRPSPKPV